MNLQELKDIDVREVNRDELVERSTIKFKANVSREERIQDYIRQIKNPYCYLDGGNVVKISFGNTDATMEDCLSHYLSGL
ncbi:MAG: hypothetical protein R3Y24_12775 [Eubacteriales bacterium]